MRVCFVLLVAAATLVGSSDATATTNDIGTSRLASADSMGQFVHQRRLLRAYDAVEDEGEERVVPADKWKNILATVDDVSHLSLAELNVLESKLADTKHEVLKDLVKSGWTPKKLYKKLNINEKLARKTQKELDLDDNYKLYLALDKYWDDNTTWLKKQFHGKSVRHPALE